MSKADIARAEAQVAEAREKLLASTQSLQARLKPAVLANDAWEAARDKGEEVAAEAVRAVKQRPVAASAAVIGVAALVARKPIWRLIARLRGRISEGVQHEQA
jgi:hypothetical protein